MIRESMGSRMSEFPAKRTVRENTETTLPASRREIPRLQCCSRHVSTADFRISNDASQSCNTCQNSTLAKSTLTLLVIFIISAFSLIVSTSTR
jgi:hypothetical protein